MRLQDYWHNYTDRNVGEIRMWGDSPAEQAQYADHRSGRWAVLERERMLREKRLSEELETNQAEEKQDDASGNV